MFSLPLALVALSGAIASAQVTGTFPATPLASKTGFTYPSGIPEKVDTDTGLIRGTQLGYNLCNSTTEGPNSLCQTSFLNGVDDFCLWAPSKPNSTVADEEGEMVAWCTKPGRGTRLIPAGALQGVQYIKTPDYAQVVGFINQPLINLAADDFGGEMDPHGADLRGNPMGGIIFSTAFTGQFEQVIEWHNFMGGGAFCFKVCDPKGPHAADYCQHIYDRIGCAYNAPNNAQNGTFEACQGDNQDFPGVYTSNGQTITYTQPAESLGPITTIPFTARIPASSNCVSHSSAELFASLPTPSGAATTPTGSASVVVTTSNGSAAPANTSNDASILAISGVSILGVVFASLFLA
ncbi:hypothetical protein P691DRAFT_714059 [Macrolepiota fuliginosa MF-IS2]|uniref:Macrofage activating glycoprotein n=1 Tax=Macrolepiota fuliginosa MF-IS2 TaxID=1400762 RepID=A0A9P5X1H4_9AGAR|nr:hypothetical protein P691DRAFT_714059 [Macrolepiota fuliginosa MF-IS2]